MAAEAAGSRHHRWRRYGRSCRAAAEPIKASVLEVDGTLYFTMPDNAWAVDARDGRELWHYFWKTQGRHPYRQSRPRDVARLSLHGDARQLPGLARCEDGKGALAQADRRSGPGVLLDSGADRDRQPRAGRDGQRYRCAGVPAVVRSRDRRPAVEVLHRSHEEGRSRPRHVGEPGCGAARRRADLDSGRVRS